MFLKTILFALFLAGDALAGVYPNFRQSFDFNQKYEDKDWWQAASFYQIYPRSYKDSNGDGVGDLNGIRDNLAYLKEIGITATWLSPIFESPMADFGYDISNFTKIDPIFGTMEDFDSLIAKSKEVGVKIILDFVPNHSSDECEWFKKSAQKDPEYKDFYVWHPGKIINGVRHPPTNWISVFRGSAWTWNEQRQEYYLHQFLSKQPDFNFRNPKVKETLRDVLRFWLARGVAGFRIDAVPHAVEIAPDSEGFYADEPRNPNNDDPNDYGYLNHVYTVDQPETLELVYEWRKVMDDFQNENGGDTRVLLTEAYSPIEVIMKYYGNETVNGAHIPFNFLMISWLTNSSDAYHYAQTINTWLSSMPKGRNANWVLGNHDKNRVGSRLGSDRIDSLNILLKTLPDCSITYLGEEIGMLDVWISWADTKDPQACNTNPQIYESFSRDPERTPFQWNDGQNAGFSNASKTWLPVSENYKTINVKNQRGIARSHLNIYKQLQELRHEPTLKHGKYMVKALNNHVLAIVRTLAGQPTYISVLNLFQEMEIIDLTKVLDTVPEDMKYFIVTDKSAHRKGDPVSATKLTLLPKEGVVLKSAASQRYYRYAL